MSPIRSALCVAAGLALLSNAAHAQWKMKQGPLMTQWASKIDPNHVLPEYPRPQLARADWQNLNGVWEYQPGAEGDTTPVGKTLGSQILVPFPVESAISGVMEHHDRLWYRRTFTVPADWKGRRIVLHFGAIDFESEIVVNGKSLLTHEGGYDAFGLDITDALNADGPQELIVRVFDPTNNCGQPRGKQSLRPGGIMYTPCSGIWQSVWMEPVAAGGVETLNIVPDVDNGQVKITVNTYGKSNAPVSISVKDAGANVATARGAAGTEIAINVPDAKLWSPDSPHLYDLAVSVTGDGDTPVDSVTSYFGMRKVSLGEDRGVKKILLNDKFIFQLGPLDQGFWPDGIYTQPTEDALKYDIEVTKQLGFNFIRKHIKVEPMRWYYWCDKIGLMVWQDMPSANSYDDKPTPPVDAPQYKLELTRMVENLRNVPSIIMWETFNENQGLHDAAALAAVVRKLDPTRLVNSNSGGVQIDESDVFDTHPYPAPHCPPPHAKQAIVNGEYGGIGFQIPGHMWKDRKGNGYTDVQSPEDLIELYGEFTRSLKKFRDENGMSAAVYTQTTDVETEVNGVMTYDRVLKAPAEQFAKANRFEIEPATYTDVTPTSEKQSQQWAYTFDKPAEDWFKTDFDSSEWKTGPGGFGTKGTPGIGTLGTVWNTGDVWLRRSFHVDKLSSDDINQLFVRLYHDEGVEVYLNGVLAFSMPSHDGTYRNRRMTDAARAALKPDGENVLAVHCHQTVFGQYVDVGLVRREPAKP